MVNTPSPPTWLGSGVDVGFDPGGASGPPGRGGLFAGAEREHERVEAGMAVGLDAEQVVDLSLVPGGRRAPPG